MIIQNSDHANSLICVVLIQFLLESPSNRSSTNSIWGSSYLWFTQEKPCKPIRCFWYSPAFDWVQISPITAHIERPKGIARNFSAVKNTTQSRIILWKYVFTSFLFVNFLHTCTWMLKVGEEDIQQQFSYYFLNIQTLSLIIIRQVLFLTLSISIALKGFISW